MKKLLALLLSLALILSFAGCGENGTATSSKVQSVASTVSKKPTSSQAEEPPFYDKTVVFTKADLDKANSTQYVKPKNVIFMIGDGMGLNDITICNKFSDFKFDFGLVFDQLKNKGFATNHSYLRLFMKQAAYASAVSAPARATVSLSLI